MDNALQAAIVRFVQFALDDDHGVSDAAMDSLLELRDTAEKTDPVLASHITDLIRSTDGTMGRNYIAG